MSEYEANLLIDINYENYKTEWEKHRWLAYINSISLGAKLKSPQDLLKFTWEDEVEIKEDNRTEKETIELQELMIKKMLGNG